MNLLVFRHFKSGKIKKGIWLHFDKIDREDIIALTKDAAEIAGIPSFIDLKKR